MTLQEIESKILELAKLGGSNYFSVTDSKGETVKIRVSDHYANKVNNRETRTLSFIINRNGMTGYSRMRNEWLIEQDGYTDEYNSHGQIHLSDILEEEL